MMTKRQKQSFLAGALTSTAGIFISKALGLLYIVPFTSMAQEQNMFFYSQAYTYYEILLSVCTAGFPFAIAAMVAKYANKNDYKTVMLIRKLSMSLMLLSGFIAALFFVAFSGAIATNALGSEATITDIQKLQTTFIILSLAVVLVPFLSVFRGFYQGLKELKIYAMSQVVEQVVRILTLLGLSAFLIYVLHMDSIYAIYMAVFSTSIAAFVAILFYFHFDRKNIKEIKKEADNQVKESETKKDLLKEMALFGLPYVAAAFLGNSMSIVNNIFFMNAMQATSETYESYKLILGIMQVQANKLTSIPQVLAIGFSAGIVPYLTIALENRDWKELQNNITQCLGTVLYIGVPLSFCLFALAGPVYYVMYGNSNLEIGRDILMWSSPIAITGTLSPICSSMMMTLRLRKKSLFYLFIGFLVKLVSFFILIHFFGYTGAITSSILTSFVVVYLNLRIIQKEYFVRYRQVFSQFLRIIICLGAMSLGFFILNWLGIQPITQTRFIALIQVGIYGVVGLLIYYGVSEYLKLPQDIFKTSGKEIIKKIIKR